MAESPLPQLPPLDGSLAVFPDFLDFHAKHNPKLPWALFPSFDDPSKASPVTYDELYKATHRIAHRARPGRKGAEGETVGVLINCDTILYGTLIQGLIRAGVVPLLISPRNSSQAVANLLEKTGSHRLILQDSLASIAKPALAELTAKGYHVETENLVSIYDAFPTLKSGEESILEEGPYPQRGTRFDLDETLIILHSSGSTGLPKPIYQTQRVLLQWVTNSFATENRKHGMRWASGGLPTFHTMGVVLQITDPLMIGQPVALFTPQEPAPPIIPTPEKVIALCRVTKSNGIPSVPAFVEAWAQSDDAIDLLKTLKAVVVGGGPLSRLSGDKLVGSGVPLQSIYGTTEVGITCGAFDFEHPERGGKSLDEWAWLTFPSDYVNVRWIPQGDGSFELQFLTCGKHTPAVENLPDVRGYSTQDLWEPHPTKEGLWRIVGRQDDVIVLGTGEKIVPIAQEGHIISNSIIAAAVMFGREKMQPGVLVEPYPDHAVFPSDEVAVAQFRNKVWPIIQDANATAMSFARIYKEMIIIADPKKPLPRSGKGTVIRKQALALYDQEIEDLYKAVADGAAAKGASVPASWSVNDVEAWLLTQATSLNDGVSEDVSQDLFEQGFDSLSATFLRNRIISALRASSDATLQQAAVTISQNFVFDNPTIGRLASAIHALQSGAVTEPSRAAQIVELLEKYASGLPQPRTAQGKVVLLTGSTGSIGAHILASLLTDENIARVYTLDRRSTSATPIERLRTAFAQRGLSSQLEGPKLTALAGDFNIEHFGLEPAIYDEIKGSLTHVIHNGWKVDFNHSLGSFETQIAGTRRLVDFCASLPQSVSVFFTSSVSVALGWDVRTGPVPEKVINDPEIASVSGYSASKYVTEQILARASDKGMHTTTLRVGQVTGSATSGAWNITDWVPILVKSSLALGMMPALPGDVSWIPVDAVADIVRDLVLAKQPVTQVVNVVHPRSVSWDSVFQSMNDALEAHLPMVPYAQWLEKLETLNKNPTPETLEDIPAIKLLEFFRGLLQHYDIRDAAVEAGNFPLFETTQLQSQSETARNLAPIGIEHARAWIKHWREQGLF